MIPNMAKFCKLLGILLVVGSVGLLEACSSSSDDDDVVTLAYNGPGSKWDANLRSDGSFTIMRRPTATSGVVLTVNGTYQRLGTGFVRFIVGSASGTDAPSPGDEAWGIEVRGYALLLKPVDPTNDQLIPMINAGTCPSSDFSANWVLVRKGASYDATSNARDFFGTFDYTAGTNTPALPARWALDNLFTAQGAGTITAGTCSNGVMVVADAEMYLTENGGAVVHTNLTTPAESSFIYALAQSPIGNINNTDGNYAGILYHESAAPGTKIRPVALSCTAGTCTGNTVTDIVAGTPSADAVTVNLSGGVDVLADGFVTGTINAFAGSGNLACMADYDALGDGRKIVSCVGQSPGNNTQMFNVILVSY